MNKKSRRVRMVFIQKLLICISLFFICSYTCKAATANTDKGNYVLVLNSYNESSP